MAEQNDLYRSSTCCHIMPLIRRHCREIRERSNQQSHQQQHVIQSLESQRNGYIAHSTVEGLKNCGGEEPKKEANFLWSTYWRQMSGPPPYKSKENRETFCLVLGRRADSNFEIRYYIEEPMERDPHCCTVDRACAEISIDTDISFGNVTADWRELKTAANGETILCLAIVFPKRRHTLSVEERNKQIEIFETKDLPLQFLLSGLRHEEIDGDYNTPCPVDCSHMVHHPDWRPLQELPKPTDSHNLSSNPTLLFASYPCQISSSPLAQQSTQNVENLASPIRKERVENEKSLMTSPFFSNAATAVVDLPNSPSTISSSSVSLPRTSSSISSENTTTASAIGKESSFLKINLYRSIFEEHSSIGATQTRQMNENKRKRSPSPSSKTAVRKTEGIH